MPAIAPAASIRPVDPAADRPGIVNGRQQGNGTYPDERNALENTKGTRFEKFNMLHVKGIPDHRCACSSHKKEPDSGSE